MLRSNGILNALLLAALVICALSMVTSQHKARKLYAQLQEQKEIAQQMDVEWGQLQLEQRTFSTPAQVEKAAIQQFQMQPINRQIRYIRLEQTLPVTHGTAVEISGKTAGNPSRLPEKK